jgi:peptidoglycan/LPS O-acetylase OafA/YrhL
MTLKDALDANKGIGPGFHFLRHALSVAIVMWHCRQAVYWTHSAELLAAQGKINLGLSRAMEWNIEDIVRPGVHALVGTFFALSGFLVAGSALRTGSMGQFFSNRALRIFPALGVETLLSALILGPIVTELALRAYFTDPEFYRYFGNIVGFVYYFLPGVFLDLPLPRTVNGQLWTLPSEFYCYFIMLGFMATSLINKRDLLLGVGVLGMALLVALFVYDPLQFDPKGENMFVPWYIVVLFFIGVLFFFHAEKIPLNLWLFIASGLVYWAIIFFNILTPLAGLPLTYCMVYVGFMSFPWWDRFIKSDYSYGLFLYHFPIIQTYMFFLLPYISDLSLPKQMLLIFGLSLPTTLVFAALSWRFIEKPALSLRKAFAKTRAVSTVVPGA